MAKRDTVNVNCERVLSFMKKNEWTRAAFSRKVGKYSSWFAEVSRGNNLPSPEEAARMCILLQTTPEEILTEKADIELVRGLLEQEREKGIKKEPAPKKSELSIGQLELIELSSKMSDDELRKFIAAMKAMLGE